MLMLWGNTNTWAWLIHVEETNTTRKETLEKRSANIKTPT